MKILLVHCSPDTRDALKAQLAPGGHELVVVDEPDADGVPGSAAGELMVFLGGDAIEKSARPWLERLGRAVGPANLFVWAVTGSTDSRRHAALFDAGADACLVEPVDRTLLASRLRSIQRRWPPGLPVFLQALPEAAEDLLVPDKIERRLHETSDELVAIYEGMADGALIADIDTGRFVRANPAMCRLTGYSQVELLCLGVKDLHPAENLPEVLKQFHLLASGELSRVEDVPVRRQDGTVVHCDISSGFLRHDGRRFLVGFFRDVTARREAKRRLAESEARLRAVFDGAPIGGVVADFKGRLIECNQAFAQMLGYEVHELLGRRVLDLTHPEERAAEKQRFDEYVRGRTGSLRFEKRYLHRDGAIVWARASVAFLPETAGEPRLLIAVVEDITGRKLAEQALKESEATLRLLIENMPSVVAMVDPDWNIHYVNRGYGKFSLKEIVGTRGPDHACDAHHDCCVQAMCRALDTKSVQTFEAQDRFGGWWSARLVPLIEEGIVRSVMLICSDISQSKAAQETVAQEQELLRRLLELFERDRELVAFEIHDGFSQQLTGALLNFEAFDQLRRDHSRHADPAFNNGLKLLRESIAEARRLVRGLRPPVLDEFGIVPAIEHLLEDHPESLGPRIEFFSGLKSGRLAKPLETAVFRMVQEMLSNIRRHSQANRARIELVQKGDSIRLTVTDWGIGFDPNHVGTDHFGLRGIRERARLLGGTAEIESAPDRGTRIQIILPLVENAPR